MYRPVHFEIQATEPERALKFYHTIFGWKSSKWDGPQDYWLLTTGADDVPGIDGGLMRRMDPSGATYNSMEVPSVDDFIAKIVENGGKLAVPKMVIQGMGYLAYCQDTEGNIFGIFQRDPSVK